MNILYKPLWLFLEQKNLKDLSTNEFKSFLKDRDLAFEFNLNQLKDKDLFRLLFSELDQVLDAIDINENLPVNDCFFDIIMQIIDYYESVQHLIKKIKSQIFQSPCLLKEAHYFLNRFIEKLHHVLNIKKILIPTNAIPLLQNYLPILTIDIPKSLHVATLLMLCFYFFNEWCNDDSYDFEKTMITIEETLNIIQINCDRY